MKTHKKRRHPNGGWSAAVSTDVGVLVVELTRGSVRQHYFGRPSYYWNATVSGSGWEYRFLALRGDSAHQLVRRALRMEASK